MTNSTKANRVFSSIHHNKEWDYLYGSVFTKLGIVDVYSQGGVQNSVMSTYHTYLRFIHEGRVYHRTINNRYTQRGLSIIANRFINEIIK